MATPSETQTKTVSLSFTDKRRVLKLSNGKLAAFTLDPENAKFVNVAHENGNTSRIKTAHAAEGIKSGKLIPSTVQAFTAAQKKTV